MGKKSKKDILKRRLKSREKAKKKRKLHLGSVSVGSPIEESSFDLSRYRPGISEMGAPPGFRSISMAQATAEYAKPLIELVGEESHGMDALNAALQASILLWNMGIAQEKGKSDPDLDKDVWKAISMTFGMKEKEAQDLINKMIERKNYLFPPEIQPKGTPFMFIRKEVNYLIRPFDYSKLKISDEKIPPDKKDVELVGNIRHLDRLMESQTDWDEIEDLLQQTEDQALKQFEKWLGLKGVAEDVSRFSERLDIFLDFVYGYMHDDIILLKSVGRRYFLEFFEDYLLRKMMVQAHEYADWPPALKLFYQFLHEKGYLEDLEAPTSLIDQIEPNFISILRKQFS